LKKSLNSRADLESVEEIERQRGGGERQREEEEEEEEEGAMAVENGFSSNHVLEKIT